MTRDQEDARTDKVPADSRLRVLQAVRSASDACDIQSVADETGLHSNTVRFHLERLEAIGLVRRQIRRTGTPGRPPLLYEAADVPDAGDEYRDYGQLAHVLTQYISDHHPQPHDASVEAGRSWGLKLIEGAPFARSTDEAVAVLNQHLTHIGFVPEVANDQTNLMIFQRHCPFLEVAQAHQEIVCSVHRGLIQGLLEGQDASVVVERLIPFAGPKGCEVRLTASTTTTDNASQ